MFRTFIPNRQLDEGGYYIVWRTTFHTIQELVEHYNRDADGLCINLWKTLCTGWELYIYKWAGYIPFMKREINKLRVTQDN